MLSVDVFSLVQLLHSPTGPVGQADQNSLCDKEQYEEALGQKGPLVTRCDMEA
jgi:hypothetical protein